jgi:prevent-host-death family protein
VKLLRVIPAGQFKAKCLAVIDEVNKTGEAVLITKRGMPVARLVAPEELSRESPEAIFGCLRDFISSTAELGDLVEPIFPIEDWDHLKEDESISQAK